jgi:MoaA/NifB/PqqE/SkfB family radical SAM enzyme
MCSSPEEPFIKMRLSATRPPVDTLASPITSRALIEFTSRCNLRCVYCARCQPTLPPDADIDTTRLGGILDELTERRVQGICANGHGETTVLHGWQEWCRTILDRGIPVSIISNFAKRFSDDETDVLSRFDDIEVSCDTADPALFARLRRGADLDTVCANMRRVSTHAVNRRRAPPRFSWSCVVTDRNVFGLRGLIDLGLSLGVSHFSFCNLTKYPDVEGVLTVNHVTELPREQLARAAASLSEALNYLRDRKVDFYYQQGLLESIVERLKAEASDDASPDRQQFKRYSSARPDGCTRDCLDPWKMVWIRANLDVCPCCAHAPAGSIAAAGSLDAVVNGEAMRKLREELLRGALGRECLDCPTRGWIQINRLSEKVKAYLLGTVSPAPVSGLS